jgi:hypothetical protein
MQILIVEYFYFNILVRNRLIFRSCVKQIIMMHQRRGDPHLYDILF